MAPASAKGKGLKGQQSTNYPGIKAFGGPHTTTVVILVAAVRLRVIMAAAVVAVARSRCYTGTDPLELEQGSLEQ